MIEAMWNLRSWVQSRGIEPDGLSVTITAPDLATALRIREGLAQDVAGKAHFMAWGISLGRAALLAGFEVHIEPRKETTA